MTTLTPMALAQADSGSGHLLAVISGPVFLLGYVVWYFVVFGIVLLFRSRGINNPAVTLLGLLAYEVPGLLRIFVFSEAWQHQWGFLVSLMILGGLTFLIKVQSPDDPENHRWWSNNCGNSCSGWGGGSNCSGGCGGGCGGGSGCGGCGGS